MAFCTSGVTELPSTPAGVISATLPQGPQNQSWTFSWLPAAKSQTKGSERTSFIKASLESIRMGVSVYKTFISGGKQSLKAHALASNMDRFIGKHGLTVTFSHHISRQTFISFPQLWAPIPILWPVLSQVRRQGWAHRHLNEWRGRNGEWEPAMATCTIAPQPHHIPDSLLHLTSHNSFFDSDPQHRVKKVVHLPETSLKWI